MLNTWRPRLVGATLVAVLAAAGCFNFDDAKERCEASGHCVRPDGGVACPYKGPDDAPDDAYEDRNCDGVDGMADGGIFVDPVRGTEGATGTAEAPLRTLSEALARVKAGTAPRLVYLAQGAYNEPGLVVDTQVALYGAYGGRDNWQRRDDYTTFLDGGPVGLEIRGIAAGSETVIDHLTVHSANPTVPGTASIALQVVDSQDVRLRYGTFVAGMGAQGSTGDRGSQGADGGVGAPGTNAVQATAGTFGVGGSSLCPGENVSGGNGQDGLSGGSLAGLTGESGLPTGLGGQGGIGGDAGVTTPGPPLIICTAGHGTNGEPGRAGDAGMAGPSGAGVGELSGTQWVANQQGGNGSPGTSGSGGGGGGSGGACKREGTINGAAGAGSGGGGGGGCGGGAGNGGGGGGASIAVLLVRSTVHFEEGTMLRTLGGGRGGTGGEGGQGGLGGTGGRGGFGDVIATGSYTSYGGDGGTGGRGGNGGPGGPGGGGGGGPSVGIWCGPDAGYSGTVAPQLAGGGLGGTPVPGGNGGQPGQQIPFQGCP